MANVDGDDCMVQMAEAREKRRRRKNRAAMYSMADPEMLERLLTDDALLHHSRPGMPSWPDQLP
jgi:hypothetical protein